MELKIEQGKTKGSAYFESEGKRVAEMTFSIASSRLVIIDHTEVDENYRGNNYGRELLDALVEKARKEGFKILPLCPFARNEFQKDRTLEDVLKGK